VAFEGLRDRWEHLAPRERTLLGVLGIAAVVCVFAVVGMTIKQGLDEIEARNQEIRDALVALETIRARKMEVDEGPKVNIPAKAISLCTYLDKIKEEVGVTIPNCKTQTAVPRGSYQETSVDIYLRDVNVYELADFLQKALCPALYLFF